MQRQLAALQQQLLAQEAEKKEVEKRWDLLSFFTLICVETVKEKVKMRSLFSHASSSTIDPRHSLTHWVIVLK